jgi:TonB family protein
MKREKKFRTLSGITPAILMPAAVLLFILIVSCGKISGGNGTSPEMASARHADKDSAYVYVDEMPQFPKGEANLLKYIADSARYPEEAKKNNISGKVLVRFVVGKDCSVSHVEILKGVDPLLDAEAVRVIKTLPEFEKPAMEKGRPVAVYYMVPITFSLK